MKVELAKSAGFCFGVRRAVQLAEDAAKTYGSAVTLGPLIHNADVTTALAEKGVTIVSAFSEIPKDRPVIIRSHGISQKEYLQLISMDVNLIDATCPKVAAIHECVQKESQNGRLVIIVGEPSHPEVLAIAGWCDQSLVIESPEDVTKALDSELIDRNQPISVVSQTTLSRSIFENCLNLIKKECTNVNFFDTICSATAIRQQEAAKLAACCNAMIVIGDRNSANSQHLAECCREQCGQVFFIENASQLSKEDFAGISYLGITAGASTPAWIIKEVYHIMSDEIKVAEVATNVESEQPQEELSFEELLESSIKTLHNGDKVKGIVAAITPTEISVDLGTKHSGYIPVAELSSDPDVKPEDIIKVGDEIETFVVRVNDVEGTAMLSKKRLDAVKVWDDINAARESKEALSGIVTEENKGGVVVTVKGIRVFVPASQTGLPKEAPMADLLKSKVRVRITEVNQARRRVVGSIKAVSAEERRARADAIWNEIEVGKRYNGVVKSLTAYGAFIDIGGIDGMVHVSELSWGRIRQPSDVLSVGDQVEVYVISFDPEKKKISLGYKDPNENPWVKFTDAYEVGSVADVKIVKLMAFGAFAEIVPGVDGLIHISQIADHRIGKPDEVLTVGETVQAKILDIDNEKKKVSLSIRALLKDNKAEEPAEEAEEAEEEAAADADVEAPVEE